MKQWLFIACLLASTPLFAADDTEVVVISTMHQMHAEMPYYSFDDLRQLVLAAEPDVLCLEVQPADLVARPDEKNKREYPEAIYPLIDASDYAVYAMEPSEPLFSQLLQPYIQANKDFREDHPEQAKALDSYIEGTYAMLSAYWKSPAMVNDSFTDSVFATKHEVQQTLIGPGETQGWADWNEHFLSVILKAVDEHRGQRIGVVVGAEHGYWLRGRLRNTAGIKLMDIPDLRNAE